MQETQKIHEAINQKVIDLLDTVKQYESDTFVSKDEQLTDDEAQAITVELVNFALQRLISLDALDGVRLSEELDAIREKKKNVKVWEPFIITDPCYIMDEAQYSDICDNGCDFENLPFPLASKHKHSGKQITFHIIEGTPTGDGAYTFKGQLIGVDAGMLCIAEGDFNGERFGASFRTLAEAKVAFPNILRQF